MPRARKNGKPRLNFKESIEEICRRTGLPANAVFQSLWTYNEIVKECMLNQVEVVFGNVGTFTYQFFVKRDHIQHRNPKTGEVFYKDYPAHYRMNFRQTPSWKKEMKEETAKLFDENGKEKEE